MSAFHTHLAEALHLNRERAAHYAAMSSGKSRPATIALLLMEQGARPLAWLFDRLAAPHNARGCGVIRDDFVPMADTPATSTPLRYRGAMPCFALNRASHLLQVTRTSLTQHALRGDLQGAALVAVTALHAIERAEHRSGAHLAMSRHLLESIAYGAANGVRHSKHSDGASVWLSLALLLLQAWSLRLALPIDRLAQRAHQAGAGIVVNDVPPIPAHAAVRALRTPEHRY